MRRARRPLVAACRYRRAAGPEQLSSERDLRVSDRVVMDAHVGIVIGLPGSRRPLAPAVGHELSVTTDRSLTPRGRALCFARHRPELRT
jgi:hypothetical protein